MNLLMISGDRALAEGKRGAFYNTLEEFHKYWDRVDIITPPIFNFQFSIFNFCRRTTNYELSTANYFGNVFIHPSPWPIIFQPLWIFRKGRELYQKNKFGLTTVHEFPPFYNGIGARLLWQKIKVPYILEIHHIPGYPKAGSAKEKIYKWLLGLAIRFDARRAEAIRVVNQKEVPEFLIHHGVTEDKIRYIPSMYIDLRIFRPVDVEKRYDLVFAARLEKNKGVFNLIEAVNIAKQTKPDIKLLIIGRGSQLKNLNFKIKNLRLQNNVVFSGWLEASEDVAVAYSSARAFINPSYNEGGPRVVLEAMACGLPIITTPVGLAHDIIRDRETGVLTDWSPVNMADKILNLLNDTTLQMQLGIRGRQLVKQFERQTAIRQLAIELMKIVGIKFNPYYAKLLNQ